MKAEKITEYLQECIDAEINGYKRAAMQEAKRYIEGINMNNNMSNEQPREVTPMENLQRRFDEMKRSHDHLVGEVKAGESRYSRLQEKHHEMRRTTVDLNKTISEQEAIINLGQKVIAKLVE